MESLGSHRLNHRHRSSHRSPSLPQHNRLNTRRRGSDASINGLIIGVSFTGLGLLIGYLWYNYLRGQQTKTAAPGFGYNPTPTTPSNPQNDTETVIS